jgi:hypothetical protein
MTEKQRRSAETEAGPGRRRASTEGLQGVPAPRTEGLRSSAEGVRGVPAPRASEPARRQEGELELGAEGAPAPRQGLTLVHVRAQLEQLQDTFMS